MKKLNLSKAALLAATALISSNSARAQVADSWDLSASEIAVTSTNTGGAATVTLDANTVGGVGITGAEITDGYKNSISNAAVGSSASSSVNAFNGAGAGVNVSTLDFQAKSLTVVSGNDSDVTVKSDIVTGAHIGVDTLSDGNSISVAAVGSSASGSATFTAANGSEVGSNTYSVGAVTISNGDGDPATGAPTAIEAGVGGNLGNVTVGLATGISNPAIDGGNANSVSVAGVGASSSYSLANVTEGDGAILDVSSFTQSDALAVTSTNVGNVTVGGGDEGLDIALVDTALITAGNGNSISVAGVGASASASLTDTTFNGGVGAAEANFAIGGTAGGVTVSALNANTDAGVTVSADNNNPSILQGNSNSISVAGVGSSGSLSITNAIYDGSAGPAAVIAAVGGDVAVNSNSSALVTVNSSITDSANIAQGSNNSISIAGVGASASTSFTTTAYAEGGNGLSATSGTFTGGLAITAGNTGAIAVNTGLNTPSISTGYNNSISAAAVGSSASQSVTQNILLPN